MKCFTCVWSLVWKCCTPQYNCMHLHTSYTLHEAPDFFPSSLAPKAPKPDNAPTGPSRGCFFLHVKRS
ncbi:hypothetical protein GDO81_008746 [Engystomops pustulosus]|uniref:Secreted protein n=1 Tax=Engystomops pustulosus TaxID=76066 RepID=A0AAV7CHU3_ENGPU|nr:hypothetical protein GDO81_008746 [Engystomops pustulosus]